MPQASPRPATTISEELVWPDVERRKKDKRHSVDRREKQDSILLNTRKIQGRRHNTGRRLADKEASALSQVHISINV